MSNPDIVAIPFSHYFELVGAYVQQQKAPKFPHEVFEMAEENAQLKFALMKMASASALEQLVEKSKRDNYMNLADALKHGRLNDDMDTIEAVERFLRRAGFGSANIDALPQNNIEPEGME